MSPGLTLFLKTSDYCRKPQLFVTRSYAVAVLLCVRTPADRAMVHSGDWKTGGFASANHAQQEYSFQLMLLERSHKSLVNKQAQRLARRKMEGAKL